MKRLDLSRILACNILLSFLDQGRPSVDRVKKDSQGLMRL